MTIRDVPTNIITGFLGVGKTTVISRLLQDKPGGERWAVLVNEFGEIGIDGGLLHGTKNSEEVFVREVPGWCMCCAAGLPMHIALNQLLAQAKPDRLLIEPTGLGHPREVLQRLSAEHYQGVLSIEKCLTLVDARNITKAKYVRNDTFNQQIDIADVVVGHKSDLYISDEQCALKNYLIKRGKQIPVYFAEHGNINSHWLHGKSEVARSVYETSQHSHESGDVEERARIDPNQQAMPPEGYVKVENTGEGYRSLGWRFSPERIFDREAVRDWISNLNVERAKGIFITREGVFGFNRTADSMTEAELDDCIETRVEIIVPDSTMLKGSDILDKLLACQAGG